MPPAASPAVTAPHWLPITLAIIAGLTAILVPLGPILMNAWIARRDRTRKKTASGLVIENMKKVQRVYELLHAALKEGGAERVLFLKGHDSGGVPRPGSPFYVSSIYFHVILPDKEQLLDDYQNLLVDHEYIQMLLDCADKGSLVKNVNSMPASQLQRFYRAEGVEHSAIWFLGIVDNNFLFVSFAKYSGDPFTEKQMTLMGLKINSIKQAMEIV